MLHPQAGGVNHMENLEGANDSMQSYDLCMIAVALTSIVV